MQILGVIGLVYVLYLRVKDTEWFGRLRGIFELFSILYYTRTHFRKHGKKVWSYADFFEGKVDANPDRVQFITVEDDTYTTLGGMERLANQLAYWAKNKQNLQQKECVALMMLNRPEVATFWLGMAKVGLSTSLVNSTITGKPFIHSITLSLKDSKTKIAVIDSDLKATLASEVAELREQGITIIFWRDLEKEVYDLPSDRPSRSCRDTVKESDPLIWIFTSGTTGLPKASKISSTRFYAAGMPAAVFLYLTPKDRMYNCLPLYHSAGGMMALGGCIFAGAPMVLRMKFSARSFTADCIKYKCTTMQYIGELCRYLINAPANANDHKVALRAVMGNGMRPDVWVQFQERYSIKRVVEFYGATEGNCAFFNSTGRVGALGYMPDILSRFLPVAILRVDPLNKEVPLRDENGHCIRAAPGEVGLLTALIDQKDAGRRFDGYSDKAATAKKILPNVFKEGDAYFNTGDLLSTKDGYYIWSDRVGDTFRWKGENVATTEVENALGVCTDVDDVTVYGVEVPNCDGRVGMAALILKEGVSVSSSSWSESLMEECTKNLAVYSRPAFLRVQTSAVVTATFKHQKATLVKEGFDVNNEEIIKSGDALFFYSHRKKEVIPLNEELYGKIMNGEVQV